MPALRLLAPTFLACALLIPARQPLAAQFQVGGSAGVQMDEKNDYFVLGGQLRLPLGRHWVFSPRAETLVGLHTTQFDADLLYQIETAAHGVLKPYVGVGGGVTHISDEDFSETKPMLNLVVGTLFAPARSRLAFYLESHYSSATNLTDREVVSAGILLRLSGR